MNKQFLFPEKVIVNNFTRNDDKHRRFHEFWYILGQNFGTFWDRILVHFWTEFWYILGQNFGIYWDILLTIYMYLEYCRLKNCV